MESTIFCEIAAAHSNNTTHITTTNASTTNTTTTNTTTTNTTTEETLTTLYGINFLILGISFVFNKIGIYLLVRAKECGISNLNVLFTHLSFVSVLYLLLVSISVHWKLANELFEWWFFIAFDIVYVAYATSLMVLCTERLLFVFLCLNYSIVISKLVVVLLIVVVWLVAVTYGVLIHLFVGSDVIGRKISTYVCNGVVVMVSLLCFVAMEIKINKTMHWTPSQNVTCCSVFHKPYRSRRSLRFPANLRRKYMLTFFVVLTYNFTVVVPMIISEVFHDNDCHHGLDHFLLTLASIHNMNFVVVPILYVAMQEKVVKKTKTMVRNSGIFENSEERERLMVKKIYEGTTSLYESIEQCSDC